MYGLARSILFQLDAEKAHHVSMATLRATQSAGLLSTFTKSIPEHPVKCMGLDFPNPIGLAAGLDKEGNTIDALGQLGFGFIEIGTLTPKPQDGNPQPRLFRLKPEQAIINRMGFNNPGIAEGVENVKKSTDFKGIVGVNIGKNKITPNEKATDDYLKCLREAFPVADYIAVNLSSPNTPGLRDLQAADSSAKLLQTLKEEQERLSKEHNRNVPIAFKVAPDLEDQHIEDLAKAFNDGGLECLIVSNTTISRDAVKSNPLHSEAGGLSGKPLIDTSTEVLSKFRQKLNPKIPIIGVGGIMCADDALAKLKAGASLIQIYTGFIYEGPKLIHEIAKKL